MANRWRVAGKRRWMSDGTWTCKIAIEDAACDGCYLTVSANWMGGSWRGWHDVGAAGRIMGQNVLLP